MRKVIIPFLSLGILLAGCNSRPAAKADLPQLFESEPVVKEDGKFIEFPENSKKIEVFK